MKPRKAKPSDDARLRSSLGLKSEAGVAPDNVVYVIDDDARLREALEDLLAASGLSSVAFGSATEYLAFIKPDVPSCLLLDLELPGMNGLDLQRQLAEIAHPPIVFITGHGDIPTSVRAIKAGAIDFLPKPVGREELLAALRKALAEDQRVRSKRKELESLKRRSASLTKRERQVFQLVVSGRLNKQGAATLGISETTFQVHRGRVMRKMEAMSLADLVRMADKLGLPHAEQRPL